MDIASIIDALVGIGRLLAFGIMAAGAALSLPTLLPHVGDPARLRSALHFDTY